MAETDRKYRIIVMTGGTSGIGEVAVSQLMNYPDIKVYVGARKPTQSNRVKSFFLDLSSLASVRKFADNVICEIGTAKIDTLVLNAGISLPYNNSITEDGFETTFAVNHLAHYMLLRLLSPFLSKKAGVIFTTSGTHNPAEKTILPVPKHANAKLLAYPNLDLSKPLGSTKAGGYAYSSSKLCNILTVRALNCLPEYIGKNFNSVAYDPGPTPGTGLVRNSNFIIQILWKILGLPPFKFLSPKSGTKEEAGKTLADIIIGKIQPKNGNVYIALRKGKVSFPYPSELALNNEVMFNLWKDSAKLVGIPG